MHVAASMLTDFRLDDRLHVHCIARVASSVIVLFKKQISDPRHVYKIPTAYP